MRAGLSATKALGSLGADVGGGWLEVTVKSTLAEDAVSATPAVVSTAR
jgi:hypothetical protein